MVTPVTCKLTTPKTFTPRGHYAEVATGAGSWLGQFVGWICVLFGIILFLISLLSFWVYMMDTDSMEGICDTDNIIVEADPVGHKFKC